MTRVLSLLAGFASPVFLCAAIAGWLYELWPANPVTFSISALLVVGGPILGIIHVATSKGYDSEVEDEELEDEPVERAAPAYRPIPIRPTHRPAVMTPQAEAAARFAAWRDAPNEALDRRERARRAARYIRS